MIHYIEPDKTGLDSLLTMDDRQFVREVYKSILHRFSDDAGREGCYKALETGVTKERIIFDLRFSPEGVVCGSEITGFNAKGIDVSCLLTVTENAFPDAACLVILGHTAGDDDRKKILSDLQGLKKDRIDILAEFYYSKEGQAHNAFVPGLKQVLDKRKKSDAVLKLPVIGKKRFEKKLRQMEAEHLSQVQAEAERAALELKEKNDREEIIKKQLEKSVADINERKLSAEANIAQQPDSSELSDSPQQPDSAKQSDSAKLPDCNVTCGGALPRGSRIYIDTSGIVTVGFTTGIQRVINAIIVGFRKKYGSFVVPIYSEESTLDFFYTEFDGKRYVKSEKKEEVVFCAGDIFLMPDLDIFNIAAKAEYLPALNKAGVKIFTILYDIIPLQLTAYFSEEYAYLFEGYLRVISRLSGVISISRTVMGLYDKWCEKENIVRPEGFINDYFYLGSDINNANPSKGLPEESKELTDRFKAEPMVLMVSTMEYRKRQDIVLAAFEKLWEVNCDANLVFVGRKGYAAFEKKLENHPERGRRLFWMEGCSDEYLEILYDSASGVIFASDEEGFGLPVIEAARHNKPLLLRNIPVFREIASDHAEYFDDIEPDGLAAAIKKWLSDIKNGTAPDPSGIKYLTWDESTKWLMNIIGI